VITANPSRLWLVPILILLLPAVLLCITPAFIVVLALAGFAPFDLNVLFAALPGIAIAALFARSLWSIVGDLLRKRPVLTIDEAGILDTRVADILIPWSDVDAAVSLRGKGRGGVVLELRTPLQTKLDPARPGTMLFERPQPGIAHIPILRMTIGAAQLEAAILDRAKANGATISTASTHLRMAQRSLGI